MTHRPDRQTGPDGLLEVMVDALEYDSILAAWQVPESASAVDVQLALLGAWHRVPIWQRLPASSRR